MSASGPVPLILLPGALGQFEGSGRAAEQLQGRRPVIVVSYREDDDLDALLGRIEAAAGAAGTGPVDLLGQSYGGWIAQCFARRQPKRVRRLVLSHSFTLSPRGAWRFRVGGSLLRRLPAPIARALLMKRIRLALRPVAAALPDLYRIQLAAIDRLAASRSFRLGLAAQQRCMWQSLQPEMTGGPRVSAEVMIIESDDDPLIGKKERAALRNLYPQARLLRFRRAGHLSAIVETERYVAAVEAFLDAPLLPSISS